MTSEAERYKYPGLNSQSTALWRKFLKYYQTSFESFEYNVRVGQGIRAPAYFTEAEKEQWKALTQKRVDVVAERSNQTWIFEIQERADLRTLGQLLGYRHLVAAYHGTREKIMLGMICARLGYDMGIALRQNGVLIFYIPPTKNPFFPPTFMPPYKVPPAG